MTIADLINSSRFVKRWVVLGVDTAVTITCLGVALLLHANALTRHESSIMLWVLLPAMALSALLVAFALGVPQQKLQSFDLHDIRKQLYFSATLTFLAWLFCELMGLNHAHKLALTFGPLFFGCSVAWRLLAVNTMYEHKKRGEDQLRQNVAIYGAGAAGIQLASALRHTTELCPVFFLDDKIALHGVVIAGLKVYSPLQLTNLARRNNVSKVLLAMPSVHRSRQNELIRKFSKQGFDMLALPSYPEMIASKGMVGSLHSVSPEQLLGRDAVILSTPEITNTYTGRVVMVTGAGGSIGSELCRQLVECRPAAIVLFEQSEFSLYSIDREVRETAENAGIKVITRLASVTNHAQVLRIVKEAGVQVILHAAAYKHVPIVEHNELEGARNNVLGTQIVADVAIQANIERFILISTDKAVRPTNIMGATKRLAEMVVQDRQTRSKVTNFSMVRFGNVLGSSGSVLPLFQKQIESGGPVTVTHPEITRFFMTIPEAARLVLLAGAYAEGGDLFVLDMGKPQRIFDIARRMIELSGHTVRDKVNPRGDIEIQIVGLRPGEKLYEELLIDQASQRRTPHPKILRAQEAMLDHDQTDAMLQELCFCIDNHDEGRLRTLITERVDGYRMVPHPNQPD